jgi:hypothetical protein
MFMNGLHQMFLNRQHVNCSKKNGKKDLLLSFLKQLVHLNQEDGSGSWKEAYQK